ncbi:hypothetical protein BJX99DRAFT_257918 [Aspergillus californicus]
MPQMPLLSSTTYSNDGAVRMALNDSPEPARCDGSSTQSDIDTNSTPWLSETLSFQNLQSLDSSPEFQIFLTPLVESAFPILTASHVSSPCSTHRMLLPHPVAQSIPPSSLQCGYCVEAVEDRAALLITGTIKHEHTDTPVSLAALIKLSLPNAIELDITAPSYTNRAGSSFNVVAAVDSSQVNDATITFAT